MEKNADRKLHGNRAKVDKSKHVVGLNVTSTVTMIDHKEKGGVPIVADDNVAYARKFVEENKK